MSKFIVKAEGHSDAHFDDMGEALGRYWELVDAGVCVRLMSEELPPELEALDAILDEASTTLN